MFGKIKKKIHIFQNIYLKNRYLFPKKTYSMDGEDLAINKFVEKKKEWFLCRCWSSSSDTKKQHSYII